MKHYYNAGWPKDKLGLCVCYTQLGEGHCVLWVDTDKGSFILDNNYAFPKTKRITIQMGVYVMRWCFGSNYMALLNGFAQQLNQTASSLFLVNIFIIIISGLIIANETHKT